MKKQKNKISPYYSLEEIKKLNALYNLIIGERTNGKTFACLSEILDNYLNTGKQGAIIRRWDLDFKRGRAQAMFAALVEAGKLDNTPYDGIEYRLGAWYLYRKDENLMRNILEDEPFCYSFALTNMEHDKSTSYPKVTTIVFDEFMTRQATLPDEFILFMNTLSTIIRQRDDVIIYMLGNTVNKESIYFEEMGLKHVDKMKQGEIQLYAYGDSGLSLAVEYCGEATRHKKKSDKYFAFDNEKLKMITTGAWELAIYPHLPEKYTHKNIKFTYFIKYKSFILQCEVVQVENNLFTYIHPKTTPLRYEDKDLIYSPEPDPRKNWRRRINANLDKLDTKLFDFFKQDKVYYSSNEIGEIVRNYLQYCASYSIIKA